MNFFAPSRQRRRVWDTPKETEPSKLATGLKVILLCILATATCVVVGFVLAGLIWQL